jgi:hypothetical protein
MAAMSSLSRPPSTPSRGQHLGAADVGAVAEIALEQRLDDAVLHALLAGQPDQAMGVERVGRAGQLVEMEFQADGGGGLG